MPHTRTPPRHRGGAGGAYTAWNTRSSAVCPYEATRHAGRTMSEIRALLLTDVVDSTKLSEQLGDAAMAEVWTAHDRVARGLLDPWRGREIDKTDGMLLLFESPADAIAYAMAYHRALAGLAVPLKARAGLHVGPGHPARERPGRHRARRQAARSRRPVEADRRTRDDRWRAAGRPCCRRARGRPRRDRAEGGVARPLDDQGRVRPDRALRGGRSRRALRAAGGRRQGLPRREDGRLVVAGQGDPEQPAAPGARRSSAASASSAT